MSSSQPALSSLSLPQQGHQHYHQHHQQQAYPPYHLSRHHTILAIVCVCTLLSLGMCGMLLSALRLTSQNNNIIIYNDESHLLYHHPDHNSHSHSQPSLIRGSSSSSSSLLLSSEDTSLLEEDDETTQSDEITKQKMNDDPHPHPQTLYLQHPEVFLTKEKLETLRSSQGPKPVVLVTGAAGFVGMHTALELKRLGMTPIAYDNINEYYSTELKQLRIQELRQNNIPFVKGDVCDAQLLEETFVKYNITRVIHLAAQAGVRYSLKHPLEYTRNNIDCMVYLLETIIKLGLQQETFIYASSSSVYGNNKKIPFQETDPVEDPASLYAATKRSDELIAHTYWNLNNISSIGLRFFTVYGPFGRPDMAPWIFTDKITSNETIQVFNHGKSQRDFTFINDIVQGIVHSLFVTNIGRPELINLGNGKPVVLADFVNIVQTQLQKKATIVSLGMQKGDVPVTFADITKARLLLGYNPTTSIEQGIAQFVQWFQKYNASQYRMT